MNTKTSKVPAPARLSMIAAAALVMGACATTGATLGSGVGDRLLDEPPYYAGARPVGESTGIVHLPIDFQRGATQPGTFEPESRPGSPVGDLIAEMNRFLDDLNASVPIEISRNRAHTPPDVRFGCETAGFGDCDSDSGDIAVQGPPYMLLAVGRPSAAWTESVAAEIDRDGAQYALVITVEVGQYWTHQKNWRGSKEVRLGTGYSEGLPWLTSLDQPVQVLQLTGALMGRDGRAVRIGAEGMVARRTNIVLSGFGAQELISDKDVEQLRTQRRLDLPGEPLVWQVALSNLVSGLTGSSGGAR